VLLKKLNMHWYCVYLREKIFKLKKNITDVLFLNFKSGGRKKLGLFSGKTVSKDFGPTHRNLSTRRRMSKKGAHFSQLISTLF
jgi:hypothetical protein